MKRILSILCALLLLTACGRSQSAEPGTEHQRPVHQSTDPETAQRPDSTNPEHHPGGEEPAHHPDSAEPEHQDSAAPASGTPGALTPLPDRIANSSADLIRERVWRGDSAGTWLPLLADVTWEELALSAGDDFDCVWEACNDIFTYVADQGQALTEEEYRILLARVQGLDGAYAEGYAGVLYDLYVLHPARFARITLDQLPADEREAALYGLLYNWGYYHELDENMDRVQQMEVLISRLEEDKKGELAASPDVMRFDYQGQSAQLLPVNTQGIYAASCTSDHPEVASVDESTGVVTAVGPGEAVITLHFEGNGENRDFTCAVRCVW